MDNIVIKERLKELRSRMKENHIDFYMIPTADYHHSEYVGDYFKAREYFSGFTGSAGTLIVSENEAGLWTDGRYFIQAEREIEGTGITLFRMQEEGVPTTVEYLQEKMGESQVLGFDGKVITAAYGEKLEKELSEKQIKFCYEIDLAELVWKDRPALPCSKVMVLDEKICGRTMAEKLQLIREQMRKKKCSAHLLCKLDDLMWIFNIRGNDVACNPVILSYGLFTEDEIHLFVQHDAVTKEADDYFSKYGVCIHDYSEIAAYLRNYKANDSVLLDKGTVSYTLYKLIEEQNGIVNESNPSEKLKAIKNEVELENIRRIYIQDSAVLTKFIRKIKMEIGQVPYDEYQAGLLLDQMREKEEGFIELSFETICGYKENAAMMHYAATSQMHKELAPEGMLLVDSGGTYFGGTTDVTRTFALGLVTEKMKEHFTAVAVGMLRLANAKFLYGCSGRNLDILARLPLWEKGIDYKCGTGHGIGYMLNVHEGPQSIRWRFLSGTDEAVLEAGMIVSDEPGVYLEGEYGIRTENILEVVKDVKNTDGQFMAFNMLTYVPIDMDLIDSKWMEPKDVELLNAYHKDVYDKLAPFMNEEELIWLKEATRQISL